MKFKSAFIFLFFLLSVPIQAQLTYKLPKVLFLTTGDGQGRGTISDGAVLALQSFNKQGIFVRLENKSVLLQPGSLKEYQIIIAPTIRSYHDLPLPEALTFLSDDEMKNLSEWVKNGGLLIAGENIGRNFPNRKDRLIKSGTLSTKNWQLADCFGLKLKEINTKNFSLTGKQGIWKNIDKAFVKSAWRLVPAQINKTVEVWMTQSDGNRSFPALTLNHYGKGKAILLPTFRLLHPADDGGLSTESQIDAFYKLVVNKYLGKRNFPVYLSPWKNARTTAYCQSFDDGGTPEQYQSIINFIRKNHLPTVFFVTPHIKLEVQKMLKNEELISLQGHSFNHPDFRKLNFGQTQNEFLSNRNYWHKTFTGFRFPYVSNSFWGLYLLNKLNFKYDTSIAANHLEFIRGSVVPYNIPIFKDDFYTSLDLLEISQIYHSDWYFYQNVLKKNIDYNSSLQQKDAKRFKEYLFNYYNKVVKPNNGVMVYLGHPMYSGISQTTLQALQDFIDYLKTQNVWITSINTVAERWNKLKDLQISVTETGKRVDLNIVSLKPIEVLSFRIPQKPKHVYSKIKYRIKKQDNTYFLIINVKDTAKISLEF